VETSTRDQFDDLLGDSAFRRTVDLIAKEVYHIWNVSDSDAQGFVLSAIGEPATLACVHAAFSPKRNLSLARVIIRRRVIDLLRKDARPTNHCSLSGAGMHSAELAGPPELCSELRDSTPRGQLELRQVTAMVRTALGRFAVQGPRQRQQAMLLQRYVLDEVDYAELSAELMCSKAALRVRVHKAIAALRKYVRAHHPELEHLLEGRALSVDLHGCDRTLACPARPLPSFRFDELEPLDPELCDRGTLARGSHRDLEPEATALSSGRTRGAA
jgi:DNA-directed RNA polymerase specialized sigma24 family protein